MTGQQNADSVPVVTFSTNLIAAQDIVTALDEVLSEHRELDPPDYICLLSAVRASFKNLADEATR